MFTPTFVDKKKVNEATVAELYFSKRELYNIHKFVLDNDQYEGFSLEVLYNNDTTYFTVTAVDNQGNNTDITRDVTDRANRIENDDI
jgi:hypothetical protein